MHIMINGNYLSLDGVLTVTELKDLRPANAWTTFKVSYKNGPDVDFYQKTQSAPGLFGTTFSFETEEEITEIYNRIIEILTNNVA